MITCISLSAQLLCGTYDDFDAKVNNVGAFHNAHMDNLKANFLPPTAITTRAQAIDYIKDFTRNYYQQHELEFCPQPLPPIFVNDMFDDTKSFVDKERFVLGIRTRNTPESLEDCIDRIEESKVVDNANMQILKDVVGMVKSGIDGNETFDEHRNKLETMANTWLTANEGKVDNGKDLSGSIIAVGLKSLEWWNSNTDAVSILIKADPEYFENQSGPSMGDNSKSITFVIAQGWLDAAGALLSGGFSLFNQLVDGHVNWNAVGRSTVGGAAFGSAGALSKIAKWLKSLF